MAPKLHKIGLCCADVEGAVRFYVEVMGLELVERFAHPGGQDYVFLRSGELLLELMPAGDNAPGFHHLSFASSEIDADARRWRERGVEMIRGPFDVGATGVRLAFFRGPDGVELQLFERRRKGD